MREAQGVCVSSHGAARTNARVAALAILFLGAGCQAPRGRKPDASIPSDGQTPDIQTREGSGGAGGGAALGPWGGTWSDPAVGPGAESKFRGTETMTGAPTPVYPLADSMHPINLLDITFQWRQGSDKNVLFRLRFENSRGKYDFYVPCVSIECAYQMPETEWRSVALANSDDGVSFTLAGTDGAGGPVARGAPHSLRFSPEPVRGGLYYWSTAQKGTYRLLFGARNALPYKLPSGGIGCFGCHSVSRDGKTIALTAHSGRGTLAVAPTANPDMWSVTPAPRSMPDSATMTLNRDGTRVLVSYGSELILRDTAGGAVLGKVPEAFLGGKSGYFPEWSPDGKEIAITLANKEGSDFLVRTGDLGIIPYNDGAFGPATVIVPATAELFHFYPSWSPDGKWIAFASAPPGGASTSYDSPMARLRLVSSAGGTVYDLARATQGIGLTSTWPKFTPFAQRGGQVIFAAFNSKMDYGLLLKNSAMAAQLDKKPQLWMFAIDLRNLATGDPSTAPVWLPFQAIDQNNHLPYWTEVVACGGATGGGRCGEGEVCKDGICQKAP